MILITLLTIRCIIALMVLNYHAMDHVMDSSKITGIVIPGQVYILVNKGSDLFKPSELYTIRADEDLAAALCLDINIINAGILSIIEFSGAERVGPETHLISVRCLNKQEGDIISVEFLLHRLRSFKEELKRSGI